jgi:hypothetical protein
LIAAIMDLYTDTKAFVQIREDRTPDFDTSSGFLQGDTLAPFLFIIVLDYVLRRSLKEGDGYAVACRRSRRYPVVTVAALAFADDIGLCCRDPAAAQRSLTRLCLEGERVGLIINAKKTEVLHVGITGAPTLSLPSGDPITECQDFRYLGSLVVSPDSIIADRRAQAWRAADQLSDIFASTMDDRLKIRILRTAVEPIFLYSLEAVPITRSREDELNAAYRALLRYALNIRYPETVTNEALATKTGLSSISATLRQRRQRLLGHVLRRHGRGEHNPLAVVVMHPPQEGFRRGHAGITTIIDTLTEDLRALDLSPTEAARLPSLIFRDRLCARPH